MKLYNPFSFNKPSIFLMVSTIIVLMALFYGTIFITFLFPGGIWFTLTVILVPTLVRVLYAILKGK